jgi:release factor glutamine methyltransferase
MENATALGLTGSVSAVRGSYLEWLGPEAAASIGYVISNPPYIRPDVYPTLAPEIVSYEPRAALVSPTPDGLGAYRSIAAALGMMHALRLVGLEIGYDQAEVVDLMRQARADLVWRVHNDYSGHPRIVIGEADG